ncbi:MAG: GGDEF domain-containing protein [Sphaerochaetaceae bacterium]|nr:GGDEF domain-containing protein [Sphaerochaetaceae bacterium]
MFPISELNRDLLDCIRLPEVFDSYRLVDPVTHQIYDYDGVTLIPQSNASCYDIWQRQSPCYNCTSYRAANENKTIVKLECTQAQTFLIISIPVELKNRKLVLELAKDVCDSLMVNVGIDEDNTDIIQLVNKMNTAILMDPYTGLYNKKFFLTNLPVMLNQSIQSRTPYCGALFDIDHFKQINDSFGHLMGDQVLLFVAEQFKDTTKDTTVKAARIGGDEFYLGFKNHTLADAREMCETLCGKIRGHQFRKDENGSFSVTISYGLAELDLDHPLSYSAFIDMIDTKMYEAKRRSRSE